MFTAMFLWLYIRGYIVNDAVKTIFLWMVIAIVLIAVFNNFGPKREQEERISYSTFVDNVKRGNIRAVTITDQNVTGTFQNNKTFATYLPMPHDAVLLQQMVDKGVVVK